jgi:hypothetical protein
MRGVFEVSFSDEDSRRHVTTFWDYSYPRDVRVDSSTNTLWLLVSGGLGGTGLIGWLSDRARLYEFDLDTRTIAHELELKPGDLPLACAPSTSHSL